MDRTPSTIDGPKQFYEAQLVLLQRDDLRETVGQLVQDVKGSVGEIHSLAEGRNRLIQYFVETELANIVIDLGKRSAPLTPDVLRRMFEPRKKYTIRQINAFSISGDELPADRPGKVPQEQTPSVEESQMEQTTESSALAVPVAAAVEDSKPGIRRLNVNLSERAHDELMDFARKSDRSVSEVVRHALALEQWWWKTTKEEKARILIERKGELRELIRV